MDFQKGILYARPDRIARVIGTGGAVIKKIQRLTGRNWQVKPDTSPAA